MKAFGYKKKISLLTQKYVLSNKAKHKKKNTNRDNINKQHTKKKD